MLAWRRSRRGVLVAAVAMASGLCAFAGAPTAVSVSHSGESGSTQTFQFVYSDPDGYADLSWMQMIFNTSLSGIGACFVHYDRPSNSMLMYNDAGTEPIFPPLGLQTFTSKENSQCIVNALTSSYSV